MYSINGIYILYIHAIIVNSVDKGLLEINIDYLHQLPVNPIFLDAIYINYQVILKECSIK